MGQAQPAYEFYTEEEYLRKDLEHPYKLEFYKGHIIAMAGASPDHGRVVSNMIYRLQSALDGKRCEVFASDLRVRNPASDSYFYPDVTVACPPLDFAPTNPQTLKNPKIVVEVLSRSTAYYDQSEKFESYRSIPSVMHVVFVFSEAMRVKLYSRITEENWDFKELTKPEESLELPAIEVSVSLAALYERVVFPQLKIRLTDEEPEES